MCCCLLVPKLGSDRFPGGKDESSASGTGCDNNRRSGCGTGFLDYRWRTWTADEQIKDALANPPVFQTPASAFSYSNTNYLLLGQIIKKVTGRAYADEIERA